MGCVSSTEDSNAESFKVVSIDGHRRPVSAGVLEIVGCDLVLHRMDKPPLKWPLISLKKFGFVSRTFTFETGRRCPTGPGIYAFRCKNSNRLFRLLDNTLKTKVLIEEWNREVAVRYNEEQVPRESLARKDAGHSDFYVLDIRNHQYVNVGIDQNPPPKPITYAELDLPESDEPQTPSPKATKSYAAIDFEKTLALSQTANTCAFEDGTRRTRHNSNLDE